MWYVFVFFFKGYMEIQMFLLGEYVIFFFYRKNYFGKLGLGWGKGEIYRR